jgi:uncharacterized protein (TIGR02594 family)
LTAFVASAAPAAARSHHGLHRVAHAHEIGRHHHARRHFASHHSAHRRTRHFARHPRWHESVAYMHKHRLSSANASLGASSPAGEAASGSSDLVMEARHHLGGNPTSRASLWCARFMNLVLARTGHRGTGSDMASSFASYGHRVSGPQVGAIAVMSRRGGGHVGIITGVDARGNPIMISGNNGNRVKEAPISRGRIYAYVLPN